MGLAHKHKKDKILTRLEFWNTANHPYTKSVPTPIDIHVKERLSWKRIWSTYCYPCYGLSKINPYLSISKAPSQVRDDLYIYFYWGST